MELTKELYEAIITIVEDKVKDIKVTREEFELLRKAVLDLTEAQRKAEERLTRLEEAVERLAEAQKKAEERLVRLEEAQIRTEERLVRLEEAVERLAEAQRKTEERVSRLEQVVERLEQAVEKLAEAQRKTEERVGRLEEAMEKLAEAQRRTEEKLGKLEETQRNLQIEIAKLSDTIGFGIEDVAKVVLPGYLERHYKIKIGEIERKFFRIENKEIEVNLYAEGKKGSKKIYLVGEAKSRIYERDVEKFISENMLFIEKFGEKNIIKVLFGFYIHPSASEIAKKNKILLVASYMR